MRQATMIGAKEVAAAAEVSISTVGRALADDPRISAETKARVRHVANNLGYVENTPARMMRGGSSKLIGLILPDIINEFYHTLADALSNCCDAQGYKLVFCTARDHEAEARHVKELVSARVAGLIIVPTASPRRDTREILHKVPHVQLLRQMARWDAAWFGIDDEECLYAGTRHLIELGHRRIAYIGGPQNLSTGRARVAGVRRALAEAGLGADGAVEMLGPLTWQFACSGVQELMGARRPPTGLITGSVQTTTAVLSELYDLKIPVPERLSVVGFGDAPGYAWWGPGLTTLSLPVLELARACGLWFLNRLQAGPGSRNRLETVVPGKLLIRGTTRRVGRR